MTNDDDECHDGRHMLQELAKRYGETDGKLEAEAHLPELTVSASLHKMYLKTFYDADPLDKLRILGKLPEADDPANFIFFGHHISARDSLEFLLKDLRKIWDLDFANNGGRQTFMLALMHARYVLDRIPQDELDIDAIIDPLDRLIVIFEQLDDGHRHPALEPTSAGRRGRRTHPRESRLRVRCILAAEALTESGMDSAAANRLVAREAQDMAKHVYKDRNSYTLADSTINRWRADFRAQRKTWDPALADEDKPILQLQYEYGYEPARAIANLKVYADFLVWTLKPENFDKSSNSFNREG